MRVLSLAALGVALAPLVLGPPGPGVPDPSLPAPSLPATSLPFVEGPRPCEPHSPLALESVRVEVDGTRVELAVELASRVAVRDVRLELRLPAGATAIAAPARTFGALAARESAEARLAFLAPGGPGYRAELRVEGRLAATGERIASTRTLAFGEPPAPGGGTPVTTAASGSVLLARSLDAPALRLPAEEDAR